MQFFESDENKAIMDQVLASFGISKDDFDKLWTTFFEILETLESYSIHLIKPVWERIETLFDFM